MGRDGGESARGGRGLQPENTRFDRYRMPSVNQPPSSTCPASCRSTGPRRKPTAGRIPRSSAATFSSDARARLRLHRGTGTPILSGRPWSGELRLNRPDGSTYTLSVSVNPIVDETGAVTHLLATSSDLTQYNALQRRFQNGFETAPHGWAFADTSGRITEANDAFCRILDRVAPMSSVTGPATSPSSRTVPGPRRSGPCPRGRSPTRSRPGSATSPGTVRCAGSTCTCSSYVTTSAGPSTSSATPGHH